MNNQNTKEAIVYYDSTLDHRDKIWDKIQNETDVRRAETMDKMALQQVQFAFYADTNDVNALEHCKLMNISQLRKFAES